MLPTKFLRLSIYDLHLPNFPGVVKLLASRCCSTVANFWIFLEDNSHLLSDCCSVVSWFVECPDIV